MVENLGKDLERFVSHVSHARKAHIKCICGLLPTWPLDLGCPGFGDDIQPIRKDHPCDHKGKALGLHIGGITTGSGVAALGEELATEYC